MVPEETQMTEGGRGIAEYEPEVVCDDSAHGIDVVDASSWCHRVEDREARHQSAVE